VYKKILSILDEKIKQKEALKSRVVFFYQRSGAEPG